ncbi:MAG: deoxyribodipyrimidine photo-lyase [Solirubrobacterales bacterium]|nr:deoxyribodipyrimidine photo-lyase [Solirubrobacterales bacterium]
MSAGAAPGGALVLFTRDLRVRDHAALASAVREHDRVLAAFVLDRELLSGSCGAPNRLAFLIDCLEDLERSLAERGTHLVVRRGDVVQETMRLVEEHRLVAIHMSDDPTPYARSRHARLARACAGARVALRAHPGITVVAPGALTPAGGDHYRVFTPYWRAWSGLPRGPLLRAPHRIAGPSVLGAGTIPCAAALNPAAPSPQLQRGGENAGREQLGRWLRGGLERYEERHDALPEQGTSRLSAYLHFGCLSPRSVLERARTHGGAGSAAFARQLCWRDFHHQVLAARPQLPSVDYRPRGDRWRRSTRQADAWRAGQTGYPIVDAGMRQLTAEGFMHNRARLIVASFLTKTMYQDWRLGAAHFASLLIDADVADNVGNWQWVAGTGNDTRPNRVLNPLRQAKRFDPHGDYVRRYVPELAGVGGAAVHEPWRLGSAQRRGLGYPEPIVEHEAAARAARAPRG